MAHYSPWQYFGLISPLLQFLQEIPVCMSPRRPQSKFQACHIACVKNSVAQNISTKFDLKKICQAHFAHCGKKIYKSI